MTKKYIFSLAREEILKLIPYKSARDDFSINQKKMIMMDANENPFENGLNRYPDPMQIKLKKRIADEKPDANDLSNLYQNNGYLFSSINAVEVSAENDTIDFEIRVNEGKIAQFNKISVAISFNKKF